MQNVKETIQYVIDVLHYLGIDYIVPEDFRQAKHQQYSQSKERVIVFNSINSINYFLIKMEKIQKLIFDLILLISTDFKIKLMNYSIEVFDTEKMKLFIIQYLFKLNCELLIFHNNQIGFNFNNMRDMLLLVGWLMGISNIFERFEDIYINQAMKQAEEIRDEVMTQSSNQLVQKRVLLLENTEEDEKFVENFNLLMSSFRQIQSLVKRKDKKINEFKARLSKEGIQMKIKEFFLMTNLEILEKKSQQMKEISEQVESMRERMKNQDIFWEWLESVVEVDKKEYSKESDYDFPQEIQNLTFIEGLQQFDLKSHESNIDSINSFYSEISESITEFNKFWQLTQRNMNKIYTEEEIAELQEHSHLIIEELDEKLPSVNQYIKQYEEEEEKPKKQDLQINYMLNFLKYECDDDAKQQYKLISSEEVKSILNSIQIKAKQKQEKLNNQIKKFFDSISNVVTSYPKQR